MRSNNYVTACAALVFSVNCLHAADGLIPGWHTSPNNLVLEPRYQSVPFVSLDEDFVHGGKYSIRISIERRSMPKKVQQAFRADSFRGKRVQFCGYSRRNLVRRFGYISLKLASIDNDSIYHCGFLKLSDNADWEKFSFVVDVPSDAGVFLIEIGNEGEGVLWFDDFEFSVVSDDVETTDQLRRDERRGLTVSPTQIGNAPRALNFEK